MSSDLPQQSMERVPEAELMENAEQARAYAEADFSEAETLFVEHFRHKFPGTPRSGYGLDLGCGPCNIAIRMASKVLPLWRFDAVDGSREMLMLARAALSSCQAGQRIHLMKMTIPDNRLEHPVYDAVFCNSLLHHLKDPQVLWRTVRMSAKEGAPIQVMDLLRPDSEEAANKLVSQYTPDAPPVLKRDFLASLKAAYRLDEVRAQLEAAGLGALTLDQVSDRHWIASGIWEARREAEVETDDLQSDEAADAWTETHEASDPMAPDALETGSDSDREPK